MVMNTAKTVQLVAAEELLDILFAPKSRPSPRWLKLMRRKGIIPAHKIGGSVFYDPLEVRAAITNKPPAMA